MKTFYFQEPSVDGAKHYAAGDKYEADENDVRHLVDLKVLGDKPPKQTAEAKASKQAPDYERDGLANVDLAKANKDQLVVIAAYEGADAPKGDGHTVDELRKAIEAKRKAA